MHRRTFARSAVGVTLGGLAGCLSGLGGDETRGETRTYDVDNGTALQVRNRNAPITVETADRDDIALEIMFRGPSSDALDAVSVTSERTDDTLRLETVADDTQDGSAALTLHVPETVRVDTVRTSNASVDVELARVATETSVETANAGIDAAVSPSLDAELTAATSNASVDVEGPEFDSVERSETEFVGTLGDGADAVSLETENAGIDVRSLSE